MSHCVQSSAEPEKMVTKTTATTTIVKVVSDVLEVKGQPITTSIIKDDQPTRSPKRIKTDTEVKIISATTISATTSNTESYHCSICSQNESHNLFRLPGINLLVCFECQDFCRKSLTNRLFMHYECKCKTTDEPVVFDCNRCRFDRAIRIGLIKLHTIGQNGNNQLLVSTSGIANKSNQSKRITKPVPIKISGGYTSQAQTVASSSGGRIVIANGSANQNKMGSKNSKNVLSSSTFTTPPPVQLIKNIAVKSGNFLTTLQPKMSTVSTDSNNNNNNNNNVKTNNMSKGPTILLLSPMNPPTNLSIKGVKQTFQTLTPLNSTSKPMLLLKTIGTSSTKLETVRQSVKRPAASMATSAWIVPAESKTITTQANQTQPLLLTNNIPFKPIILQNRQQEKFTKKAVLLPVKPVTSNVKSKQIDSISTLLSRTSSNRKRLLESNQRSICSKTRSFILPKTTSTITTTATTMPIITNSMSPNAQEIRSTSTTTTITTTATATTTTIVCNTKSNIYPPPTLTYSTPNVCSQLITPFYPDSIRPLSYRCPIDALSTTSSSRLILLKSIRESYNEIMAKSTEVFQELPFHSIYLQLKLAQKEAIAFEQSIFKLFYGFIEPACSLLLNKLKHQIMFFVEFFVNNSSHCRSAWIEILLLRSCWISVKKFRQVNTILIDPYGLDRNKLDLWFKNGLKLCYPVNELPNIGKVYDSMRDLCEVIYLNRLDATEIAMATVLIILKNIQDKFSKTDWIQTNNNTHEFCTKCNEPIEGLRQIFFHMLFDYHHDTRGNEKFSIMNFMTLLAEIELVTEMFYC